ncbi:MAG: substrate-binding domain-containing protein [Phycisphaeraceae bacterium]
MNVLDGREKSIYAFAVAFSLFEQFGALRLELSHVRVLVLGNFADCYNRGALHGAAAYARQHGWELMQHHVRDRPGLEAAIRDADALLLGAHLFESDPLLTRTTLPAVSWSATLAEVNWPRVLPDDLAVGRLAADHFMEMGLRRFAFFTDLTGIWVDRRREGLLARIEATGHGEVVVCALHPQSSVEQVGEWLQTLTMPVGLMLVHDGAAIKVMAACKALGLRIPEDVAIVGVNDDDRIVGVVSPPLSTVPLQMYQIGYESADLLAQIISKPARKPWSILVPPGELIVRESSDVLGRADNEVGQAVRFIREHLGNGVETKQVVAHMGVCRTTLNTKFQAMLGRSVAAEVRRARIERCRHLLSTTDEPMPVIAEQSGFSSARQLSETFHRETGQTPTSYRRKYRGGL